MKHVISVPKAFKKAFSNATLWGFCLDVLTVIIGIAITFYVQELIDRSKTESDVRAVLKLVRDELSVCKEDIEGCAKTMEFESAAAEYFLINGDRLQKCPQDTVLMYGRRLVFPTELTLSEEAIDMMKNSSLFQAIDDNTLALSILRAYDICNVLKDVFNYHENSKNSLLKKACKTEGITGIGNVTELFDFPKLMRDEDARATLATIRMNSPRVLTSGLVYIDEAISQIDAFLDRK